ncbi:MAG: porin family protein [Bacteroidota bacterium]
MKTSKTTFEHSFVRAALALVLSLGLITLISTPAAAQKLKFGPRVGLASSGISASSLNIQNGDDLDALKLDLQESSSELQMGVFARVQFLGLYLQPEVLLTTASTSFAYEDLITGATDQLTERYVNVEVPIMAGLKLGPLRVQGGPVYRMNLLSRSDLRDIDGLNRSFKEASVGLQAGVGLDLGKKIVVDLKYESDISAARDELTIFGNTHQVAQHGGRLIGSVGFSF